MSILSKYNVIISYLETAITSVSGLENLTFNRGRNVELNHRPSVLFSLAEPISSEIFTNTSFEVEAKINIGLDVLWMDEADFLDILDLIVAEINENGTTQCGVEFIWVGEVTWDEENKKYRNANIQVATRYYV